MRTRLVRAGAAAALAIAAIVAGGAAAPAAPTTSAVALPLYFNRPLCVAAGELGIQQGRWTSYVCVPQRVGLDIYYRLVPNPL